MEAQAISRNQAMARRKFSERLVKLRELSNQLEENSRTTYVRYGTEHLLVSIAEQSGSEAAAILAQEGFVPEKANVELESVKGRINPNKPQLPDSAWGPSAYELFRSAEALAGRYESPCVDDEHLLLAIVQQHKSGAYELLGKLKVSQQKLENALVKRLQETAKHSS